MKRAHKIWLLHHPNRDMGWLKDRFADGFEVHHIDGDIENNDIDNLVLIEGGELCASMRRRKQRFGIKECLDRHLALWGRPRSQAR